MKEKRQRYYYRIIEKQTVLKLSIVNFWLYSRCYYYTLSFYNIRQNIVSLISYIYRYKVYLFGSMASSSRCFAPNLRPIIATEEAISNLNETLSRSPSTSILTNTCIHIYKWESSENLSIDVMMSFVWVQVVASTNYVIWGTEGACSSATPLLFQEIFRHIHLHI